jgi:glycosyltransferase involved in cell wall biosynthesis
MNKKTTITIGIPVYNEEKNIAALISDIVSQKCVGFEIREIIVSSDGSTDKTVEVVGNIKDSRMRIISNKERKGISRGLNQITLKAKGNILVTLDGDIRIYDKLFLQKLISPIVQNNADLTSSAISEIKPKSFVANSLLVSMQIKECIFDSMNGGNNLYTCHGLARAYSEKLYKNLCFPISIGNDMFSYLYCISNGLKYIYSSKAIAWYKLPETFEDHKKQSLRFFSASDQLKEFFGEELIDKETKVSKFAFVIGFVRSLPVVLLRPLHTVNYIHMQIKILRNTKNYKNNQAWDIAVSSKEL